ncbi:hypothetical protein SNEBB_007644 [Seison nebaliae]|nr:hypothetical protein SNEBB_007644 [Seison nebaliae]
MDRRTQNKNQIVTSHRRRHHSMTNSKQSIRPPSTTTTTKNRNSNDKSHRPRSTVNVGRERRNSEVQKNSICEPMTDEYTTSYDRLPYPYQSHHNIKSSANNRFTHSSIINPQIGKSEMIRRSSTPNIVPILQSVPVITSNIPRNSFSNNLRKDEKKILKNHLSPGQMLFHRNSSNSVTLIFRAIFFRLCMIIHLMISTWHIEKLHNNRYYWLFLVSAGILLLDGIIISIFRGGKDWSKISYCSIFYMASLLPIIWILHLDGWSQKIFRLNRLLVEHELKNSMNSMNLYDMNRFIKRMTTLEKNHLIHPTRPLGTGKNELTGIGDIHYVNMPQYEHTPSLHQIRTTTPSMVFPIIVTTTAATSRYWTTFNHYQPKKRSTTRLVNVYNKKYPNYYQTNRWWNTYLPVRRNTLYPSHHRTTSRQRINIPQYSPPSIYKKVPNWQLELLKSYYRKSRIDRFRRFGNLRLSESDMRKLLKFTNLKFPEYEKLQSKLVSDRTKFQKIDVKSAFVTNPWLLGTEQMFFIILAISRWLSTHPQRFTTIRQQTSLINSIYTAINYLYGFLMLRTQTVLLSPILFFLHLSVISIAIISTYGIHHLPYLSTTADYSDAANCIKYQTKQWWLLWKSTNVNAPQFTQPSNLNNNNNNNNNTNSHITDGKEEDMVINSEFFDVTSDDTFHQQTLRDVDHENFQTNDVYVNEGVIREILRGTEQNKEEEKLNEQIMRQAEVLIKKNRKSFSYFIKEICNNCRINNSKWNEKKEVAEKEIINFLRNNKEHQMNNRLNEELNNNNNNIMSSSASSCSNSSFGKNCAKHSKNININNSKNFTNSTKTSTLTSLSSLLDLDETMKKNRHQSRRITCLKLVCCCCFSTCCDKEKRRMENKMKKVFTATAPPTYSNLLNIFFGTITLLILRSYLLFVFFSSNVNKQRFNYFKQNFTEEFIVKHFQPNPLPTTTTERAKLVEDNFNEIRKYRNKSIPNFQQLLNDPYLSLLLFFIALDILVLSVKIWSIYVVRLHMKEMLTWLKYRRSIVNAAKIAMRLRNENSKSQRPMRSPTEFMQRSNGGEQFFYIPKDCFSSNDAYRYLGRTSSSGLSNVWLEDKNKGKSKNKRSFHNHRETFQRSLGKISSRFPLFGLPFNR